MHQDRRAFTCHSQVAILPQVVIYVKGPACFCVAAAGTLYAESTCADDGWSCVT